MFTTQFKSIIVAAALTSTATMATTSEAQAVELSDLTGQIEQVISTQTQQMLQSARQELVLSLRLQVAEAMTDLEGQVAATKSEEDTEEAVILTTQKPE
ncbi:hypothetical protein L2750_15910 [Shewanella submarina]|uniref:Secreted protein n=1 Tax=Shewanella submarina TaxID=2016376 RepID=A0ABV7G8A3_9GAMM|nr:hypothetical protein [Shewanella submarina]MCL1038621.1 hypothetical protein [Shewanella submarina]